MSTINYTYNVIVDRFRQFAAGHFQLRRFTHGEISQADLEKEAEWPWLHVKPRAINYSPGTRSFQFEIFISDLPRDKEDKTGYQAESITDCSLIFQDLINEIYLGNMFGTDVVLTRPVSSEPFVEQYTHTLTGVTGTIELNLDYDWSACSIPASWNYNTPTDSPSDGWGALQFIDSLNQNGVYVSLLNDVEAPGNSYYYGTNALGVKGWYAIVDNVGLTCETLPDCATIISIVDDIAALQSDKVDKIAGKGLSTEDYTTAEKSKLAGIEAGAEVNVNADWNAVSGDAQILNKPTIPSIAGLVPETRTLTINGTTQDLSANRTFTIATGLTVGTTPITSGTVGRVLFEGTGNVLQESANFFWDNTNARLGVGTATPLNNLHIFGASGTNATLRINTANRVTGMSLRYSDGADVGSLSYNNVFYFTRNDNTFPLYLSANSNVLINTITDAGYKLDVNGTARVRGTGTTNATIALTVQNSASTNVLQVGDGSYLYCYGDVWIDNDFRRIFSGAGRNAVTRTSTGTSTIFYNAMQLASGAAAWSFNSDQNYNLTAGSINGMYVRNSFSPTSGTATFSAHEIISTINQTGGANGITRGLYINPTLTAAADFRAIETTAGKVCLNTSSGNTMIGTTTDAGFKLDVNGTARLNGATTFPNSTTINGSGNLSIGAFTLHGGYGFATFSQTTLLLTGGTFTSTSGNQIGLSFGGGFAPTSGTATYSAYSILPTINQTGTANGITRGIHINPTLTSAADWRAIEVASGITILGAATTAKASLRIPSGTAPTSPVNGDIWFDGTDIKMRIGGVTKTFTLI